MFVPTISKIVIYFCSFCHYKLEYTKHKFKKKSGISWNVNNSTFMCFRCSILVRRTTVNDKAGRKNRPWGTATETNIELDTIKSDYIKYILFKENCRNLPFVSVFK